ncbi:hypothetical protein ETQ85_04800 [Zoogloea oleivorans]|uniref:Uncharacterized protein n=1 Tax=Zoogloea oleivorans TaxID=1552750 RepID=A0A6C2D2Q8_9RHOO|nr:hypothetical protein [Zoogloea oleivorans]TYC60720.1 hypothetical protein ETQ85_04800 [Zoogloea oleivorans]
MPIPKDYKDIVTALFEKTNAGRVNWKNSRFGIEVKVDKSKFKLWSGTDENTDEAFVAFALNDLNGSTMDSWYVDEGDADYDQMTLLFSAAKRYANGVPQRLSELKNVILKLDFLGESEDDEL